MNAKQNKPNAPALKSQGVHRSHDSTSEKLQVKQLLLQLGAVDSQAEVMARQLLRRADQVAAERGIERLQALDQLLRAVINGRNGIVDPSRKSEQGEQEVR